MGRIVGAEAMKFGGWQRLNAEYARQFGIETPKCRLRRLKSRESRRSQNNAIELEQMGSADPRWLSIAFTVAVIVNFVAVYREVFL